MYRFKLPIGDWSDDGHGKCEYFVVESNVPFEDIVPAYIAMDKEYEVSGQCEEYEDYRLTKDFMEFMKEKGLKPDNYIFDDDGGIGTFDLAQLIIDLMMTHDPDLSLQLVHGEEMPMLNNWAAQKIVGGSLDLPGYGLFE